MFPAEAKLRLEFRDEIENTVLTMLATIKFDLFLIPQKYIALL